MSTMEQAWPADVAPDAADLGAAVEEQMTKIVTELGAALGVLLTSGRRHVEGELMPLCAAHAGGPSWRACSRRICDQLRAGATAGRATCGRPPAITTGYRRSE
jgi:hypothetical protein